MALAAYAFLESLKGGSLDESSTLPERLSRLNQSLYPFTKAKKTLAGFRLGLLKKDGDAASGHAALYSQNGLAIAEIYLSKTPSGWKVEDFKADFTDLEKPREKKEERYEPGDYKAFTPF